IDPAFIRPAEVDQLIGDSSKARSGLGWTPDVDFRGLIEMMVDADLERLANSKRPAQSAKELAAPALDGGARLALRLSSLDRLSFVEALLALRQSNFELRAPVLEIHPQRHDRHALFGGLPEQLAELLVVQQELPRPYGIVR